MQLEDCRGGFQKKNSNEAEEIASLDMRVRNQYSSINFPGGFFELGISIVNFFWAISTLSCEQNANRRCTCHATMSPKRANNRLITVRAPFLAIAPNQNATLQFVLCTIDPQC